MAIYGYLWSFMTNLTKKPCDNPGNRIISGKLAKIGQKVGSQDINDHLTR